MESIGVSAFYLCNFTNIISKAQTAPSLNNYIPDASKNVYIPKNTTASYESTWAGHGYTFIEYEREDYHFNGTGSEWNTAANGRASDVNWFTISSPLTASTALANVKGLIPTTVTATDYDLYRLDEENGIWVNSRVYDNSNVIANPDFTTIDKGVGYIYHIENGTTLEFNGKINVGDVERSLTTGPAHGYNLIGNPFTQNIKLSDVVSQGEAELATGFYVLSNENTWGARLTDGEIKPLQGFLVQATVAGDVTISKPSP